MSRFNLIDEKWIPVRFLDGRRDELGIQETLLKAKDIAAIEDPSPLVTAALHRFLLAVLYRALMGPTDIEQAKKLFREGLPEGKIKSYLEKWRNRFFLFDEHYPFYQIQDFSPQIWRAWTVLAAEHNAKVLFDHIDVELPGSISPAIATRWLLATQTFSVSAGKSELSHTGTSPSATAAMVLPLGKTLEDTLLFALVPQNREVTKTDLPIWEREPEVVVSLQIGPKRPATGWADRYTWRVRAVRLQDEVGEDIRQVAFASGIGFEETGTPDPMLGYRVDEKYGRLPLKFQERGLWRNFDCLLPDQTGLAPLVIQNAIGLGRGVPERFPSSFLVLGQGSSKAKVLFWRFERFELPRALNADREVRREIQELLEQAEAAGKSLLKSCRNSGRFLITKGKRKLQEDKWAKGKKIPGDVTKFISSVGAVQQYWSDLESRFHEMLGAYIDSRSFDDIERDWLVFVRRALEDAWQMHRSSVSLGDAWALRAMARADGPVLKKIKELGKRIRSERGDA